MTPTIDYNKFPKQALPPDKRIPYWIAILSGLIYWIKRLYGIFYQFQVGSTTTTYWSGATTYAIDAEVILNHRVYKSLSGGNLNNNPSTSPVFWEKILDWEIGINERASYNAQKICLEWALNKYFKKELGDNGFIGFKQPNSAITPIPSDIFIDNLVPAITSFVSFTQEAGTSLVFTTGATGVSFTNTQFVNQTYYTFNVNIPTTVYASINASALIAETIVRQFLDKFVPSGISYLIVTY